MTVKWKHKGKVELATVMKSSQNATLGTEPTSTTRVLNTTSEFPVPISNLESCTTIDPTDVPLLPNDINPEAMTQILSKEDLPQHWHKDQVTLTNDHKLFLYWHQRMQCPTHVSMVRLSEQGTIPPALKHIRKAPPCAVCIFAKAQKQAWRTKGGRTSSIRKKHHNTLRKGTSANHMISHQPGLILQVTGTLTHERYWGTTTM
eukprot:15000861-Ditylum_brightwellii.AAC.1